MYVFSASLHTFLLPPHDAARNPTPLTRLVWSTKNNINTINTIDKQKKGHGQHGGTVSGAANLR